AGAQQLEKVEIAGFPDLDLAGRVPGVEGFARLVQKLADGRADEADPQHAFDAAGGRDCPVDAFADLLVSGPQVVVEAAADRGQRDWAAGPLEQRRPDPPL